WTFPAPGEIHTSQSHGFHRKKKEAKKKETLTLLLSCILLSMRHEGCRAAATLGTGNPPNDMRRPGSESVETFRARQRKTGSIYNSCRFLQQKLFFDHDEKNNIKRAHGAASVPADDSGVSIEAWGRIARQVVFTAVKRIAARFDEWKRGCPCDDGPVEMILFQPVGGVSVYHRSICRDCRCPRDPKPLQERAMTACDGEAAGEDEARLLTSIDGSAGVSDVPPELLRSPFDLPSELSDALNGLDTPKLMTVCVRSVKLIYERRGPDQRKA
ncbi:MAG: hypothetical protein MI923_12400, partial [Phycisphaerales bacterium]|nr:hypothetical protein [Phycisphaerales bacterium]